MPDETAAVRRPKALDDLAVFSGRAAFAEPRHVGRPNIGDRAALLRRVADALERRWLTNDGRLVREFEARVAATTGAEHCVAVVNATLGLELLARALDLSGEVILPAWTFVGTAHALRWVGLTPVFADIDPATHNLDPEAVERLVTPETSAVLGVHLWGRPCDPDRLADTADRHGLHVIFDAAHALGCSYKGRALGGLGRASVFSFHATKVANACEGGAITTDDPDLADRLRRIRNFGFYDYDAVRELGTNAKMNEFSAAMGITSLESLDAFVDINRRNHAAYERALAATPELRLLPYPRSERHNYHYVVVELSGRCRASRDDLVAVLHAENVVARRYFHPGCHRMEPYRGTAVELACTEDVSERVLVLPTGTAVSIDDIDVICAILRLAIDNGDAVRQRLSESRPVARG